MKSLLLILCGACLLSAEEKTTTLTGWFSDEGCAKGRVAQGLIEPTNPDCAKKCLDKGAQAVFISEQGKEMIKVAGYAAVKDNIGYRLEITGALDAVAKTISIESVKRIGEYQGPSCARPKKK